MKCEFVQDKNMVRLIPEGEEVEKFNQMFPDSYLKTSKVCKSKGFVDQYGNPTGIRYLMIRGHSEKKKAEVQQPEPVAAQA